MTGSLVNGRPDAEVVDQLRTRGFRSFFESLPDVLAHEQHQRLEEDVRQELSGLKRDDRARRTDRAGGPKTAEDRARAERIRELEERITDLETEAQFPASLALLARRAVWAETAAAVRGAVRREAGARYWATAGAGADLIRSWLQVDRPRDWRASTQEPFTDAPALPGFDDSVLREGLARLDAACEHLPRVGDPPEPRPPARSPSEILVPIRAHIDLIADGRAVPVGRTLTVPLPVARRLITDRAAVLHHAAVELDFVLDSNAFRQQRGLAPIPDEPPVADLNSPAQINARAAREPERRRQAQEARDAAIHGHLWGGYQP